MKVLQKRIGDLEVSASKEGHPPVVITHKGDEQLRLWGEEEIRDMEYALKRAIEFLFERT